MPENFESVFGRRIVGAKSKEERVKAKENLKEGFLKGEEEIASYERPKTERDKEIIGQAENSVDNLIREVGGNPKPLGEKRIHFLKDGGVNNLSKGEQEGAIYLPTRHCIAIDRPLSSDVAPAINLQHELFHLKGLKRAAIEKGIEREPIIRRSGMRIFGVEQEKAIHYLGNLEHGMISILNHILFKNDIKNNPLYEDELKIVEKIKKPWLSKVLEKKGYNEKQQESILQDIYTVIGAKDLLEFLESEKPEEDKIDYLWKITERSWKEPPIEKRKRLELEKPEKEEPNLVMAERTREFKEVDKLVGEILEKSGGEFEDRWEVISEFAKAHFTGNLSPVRKMTERILGKGAWREIMEKFSIEDITEEVKK